MQWWCGSRPGVCQWHGLNARTGCSWRGVLGHMEAKESQEVPNYSEQLCVYVCLATPPLDTLQPGRNPPLCVTWKKAESHLPLEKQRGRTFSVHPTICQPVGTWPELSSLMLLLGMTQRCRDRWKVIQSGNTGAGNTPPPALSAQWQGHQCSVGTPSQNILVVWSWLYFLPS